MADSQTRIPARVKPDLLQIATSAVAPAGPDARNERPGGHPRARFRAGGGPRFSGRGAPRDCRSGPRASASRRCRRPGGGSARAAAHRTGTRVRVRSRRARPTGARLARPRTPDHVRLSGAASAANVCRSSGDGRSRRAGTRPHHSAAIRAGTASSMVAASRAAPSTSRHRGPGRASPGPFGLAEVSSAPARAAPRLSGVRDGRGRADRRGHADQMRPRGGDPLRPDVGDRRRSFRETSCRCRASISVPRIAARGAVPASGSAETAGGRTLGT